MKKTLLSIISTCAIFCGALSCQKEAGPAADLSLTHFEESGVEYTITAGAPFDTKADDGEFFTVTGQSDFQIASLVCENIEYNNGTTVCRQYNIEGELLATLVFSGDSILGIELTDLVLEDEDYVTRSGDDEEQGNEDERGNDEKFGHCVKRMYKELKENLVEGNTVSCELSFSATICSAVAEVAAIVKCL